jgi:hypothetical protein
MAVTNGWARLEIVFVLENPFQPVLMFASKAGAYLSLPILGAALYGKLLALPPNIRLVWKGLPWTNTIAYFYIVELHP